MNLKKIFIGTAISFAISLVFMCILAIVVYFSNIQDRTVSSVIFILSALSVFIGAFLLARSVPNRGLLNGIALGGVYFIVLVILSVLVNGNVSMSSGNFLRLLSELSAGALGGVLGINTGRDRD